MLCVKGGTFGHTVRIADECIFSWYGPRRGLRFADPPNSMTGEIEMKTHYQDEQPDDMNVERAGFVWALCGKLINEASVTDNDNDCTCGSCDRILKNLKKQTSAGASAA